MSPEPTEPTDPLPGFVVEPVPPELLAWARRTFNEEEFWAGVREIEETGSVPFETIIAEVEAIVRQP
ncbi:MAG: hypothetical protein K2X87_29865 [Gemmataceae bacterium]|nr:hypothetical protein [Gemmataceae bacterium]